VGGLVVRCGDVAALAAALLRLVGGEGLRRRLGQAGRDRPRHEFDWGEKFTLVRQVYEEVLPGRPREPSGAVVDLRTNSAVDS
jgi:glycosyltransferase involved in cell wall biosynthesis